MVCAKASLGADEPLLPPLGPDPDADWATRGAAAAGAGLGCTRGIPAGGVGDTPPDDTAMVLAWLACAGCGAATTGPELGTAAAAAGALRAAAPGADDASRCPQC
jgi:hypothetical protein